ncbi:hypothetical protein B0H14DRAFT_3160262 [Mycena olivaceomarginata]|nr:hypothetical protein B0H14DRAFT_3160262 [Mycena olivaceomarginata]
MRVFYSFREPFLFKVLLDSNTIPLRDQSMAKQLFLSSAMSSTELAVQILTRLLSHNSLKDHLQFGQIQRFLELARQLWLEIVPPSTARPIVLPKNIASFMSSVLELKPEIIQLTWHAYSDLAQALFNAPSEPSLDDNFKQHGHAQQLGPRQ